MLYEKRYALKALQQCIKIVQSLQCNEEIYNTFERSSIVDILMCSKYTSAYIYIQVSPREIICVLNIFTVEYLFLTFHVSLFLFNLYDSFPVTLPGSSLTQNTRDTSSWC